MRNKQTIDRRAVAAWLHRNAPELAVHEEVCGSKGVYRKAAGLVSYQRIGSSWYDVGGWLGMLHKPGY